MNYLAFKTMIDNLISTYKCPFCNFSVLEENVDVVWAAGSSVNLAVLCNWCKKSSIIKAEVAHLDLLKEWSEFPGWHLLANALSDIKKWLKKNNWRKLSNKDLKELQDNLKDTASISSLFNKSK